MRRFGELTGAGWQRYELYKRGLSDKVIAKRLNEPVERIARWRRSRGLPKLKEVK